MEGDSGPLKLHLVLPTLRLPPALAHLTNPPTTQFLLGYRNVITAGEAGLSWGLVKNSTYCGRAFVYEISEEDAHNIQQIKQSSEYIEFTSSNYILLKVERETTHPTDELTTPQLAQLLSDVGGVSKITLNLVKNAFDSVKLYQLTAGKAVEALNFQERRAEVGVGQSVQLQFNLKSLSGASLLQVPVISKETGGKVQGSNLSLKVSAN